MKNLNFKILVRGCKALIVLFVLTLTVQQGAAVTLAWDQNPNPATVGYKLYYGPASLTYTNVIDFANLRTNLVSGLVQDATYFFTVTAYNAAGLESDFSSELSYTVTAVTNTTNTPPMIVAIADKTISLNTSLVALPFTISDLETPVASLTVSGSSSNTTLVPNGNILFGGSGANRTVTINPVANLTGTTLISLTVSDGNRATAIEQFLLTVLFTNAAPTLNAINNLTINEDAGLQTINLSGITAGGSDSSALTVTAQSSNTGLIPTPVVTYVSPASSGTLKFTPSLNGSGTATITVTVNDGQSSNNITTRTFTVTVNAVNEAPTIFAISPLSVAQETATGISGISIGDIDAGTGNLTVTLQAGHGQLQIATNVAGGLRASHLIANGSGAVQITAPLAALNATLSSSNGLTFTGNAGFAGTDMLAVTANDNGNTGSGGALIATTNISLGIVATSQAAWRSQYFSAVDLADPTKDTTVWGDTADPDQDGLDNLLEFAVGLDPLTREGAQQAITTTILDLNGSKYFNLNYTRRKNAPLLQYVPEVSSDKLTWTSGPTVIQQLGVADAGPVFEIVSCQDLTPISPGNPRFLRLRIIKN